MKFQHVGRLVIDLKLMENMTTNVQMHQAYASTLSPFIVIEARVNVIEGTIEQVIFDPSGARLPRVEEGELVPKVILNIGRVPYAQSIHDNPYYSNLVIHS